jgi:hypothetical protein
MQREMGRQQGAGGGCWTSIWTGERAERDVKKGKRSVTCAGAQRKRWKKERKKQKRIGEKRAAMTKIWV